MMFEFIKEYLPKFEVSPIEMNVVIPNPFGGEEIKCQISVKKDEKSGEKKENGGVNKKSKEKRT